MEDRGLSLTFDFKELSNNRQISLSFGADYIWDLKKRFKCLNSSLVVIQTVFRWSLLGRCDERTDSTLINFILSERKLISAEMRCFWELGSLGIRRDEIDSGMEHKEGLKEFNLSVKLVENKYCIKLIGEKSMQEKLGNNSEMPLRCFKGLVENFKSIRCCIKSIERLLTVTSKNESLFHLPHHAVV
ncbi:DUF1758 domain-containing protein [Nephila pilipes]|uniref:DUF1758 domain-containing protein n=1 Tax=Nephila pilipes TaxID=299642 RepID=A0A8X6TTR4_NEPPI|nr:DUF1758 domain-containing protein [Nephila pilipes]